jgi:hypothetical protein
VCDGPSIDAEHLSLRVTEDADMRSTDLQFSSNRRSRGHATSQTKDESGPTGYLAQLYSRLMKRLGYTKFVAQGGA